MASYGKNNPQAGRWTAHGTPEKKKKKKKPTAHGSRIVGAATAIRNLQEYDMLNWLKPERGTKHGQN